jgi:hypothetical protein
MNDKITQYTLASLQRLREDTEEILQDLVQNAGADGDGSVNWADLHCIQARHFYTSDDMDGLSVHIEEASPEAWKLREEVAEALMHKGWRNVNVITEW